MNQVKTPKHETTVLDALKDAVKKAEENEIHTFIFVGLHNDGDSAQTITLGTEGYEFQTIGCLEIIKRDVLNQVPALEKGEM